MTSKDITDREVLTEAIRQTEADSVLVGWVIIAEFIDEEGNRPLRRLDSNASGEGLVDWIRSGYLYDALFSGGWESEDDE